MCSKDVCDFGVDGSAIGERVKRRSSRRSFLFHKELTVLNDFAVSKTKYLHRKTSRPVYVPSSKRNDVDNAYAFFLEMIFTVNRRARMIKTFSFRKKISQVFFTLFEKRVLCVENSMDRPDFARSHVTMPKRVSWQVNSLSLSRRRRSVLGRKPSVIIYYIRIITRNIKRKEKKTLFFADRFFFFFFGLFRVFRVRYDRPSFFFFLLASRSRG